MPPKPFPTHFLCLPLVNAASRPQLAASLAAFAADVTSPDSFGIPAGAVRPVGTLHLTLGVMSLPPSKGGGGEEGSEGSNAGGVERAVELLRSISPRGILAEIRNSSSSSAATADKGEQKSASASVAGGGDGLPPLTLRGLHSMQPASRATTLYAAPVNDGAMTLQRFCERLRAVFEEAGVMVPDARPLLLHATIVNTIYVKGRDRARGGGGGGGKVGKGKGGKEKMTLDARGILDRYDDFVWMENVPIDKIAICRMGAKDVDGGRDQAYEVEAEIDI